MNKLFNCLLVALPLTWVADHFHWPPMAIMFFACLGVIPIAKLMGEATEHISHRTNPTVGGLLSATFGNACELIIAVMALHAGLIEVVKASLTGSIIGNVLLVFGASMVAGGAKHEVQQFNKTTAGTAAFMLTISALALLVPAAMHHTEGPGAQGMDVNVALLISGVLITLYVLMLFFSLKTHKHLLVPVADSKEDEHDAAAGWSLKKSFIMLGLSTLAVFYLSEHLVDNVEHVALQLGMTPIFVGVILLAIIGNAAENSSAIVMSRKNKMDLSLNIVAGSSMQIAMFVAPVLVFAGWAMGQPMDLVFTQKEIIAVVSSVVIMNLVVQDGKSHWLEGAGMLAFYAILGICFYFD
jgi:Ca2+:H+ antiporter